MSSSQTIIGAQEWCKFPELGVPLIKAHINSCLPISCLQVYNLQTVLQDNTLHVRYDIKPLQHNLSVRVRCKSIVINRINLNNTRCYVINTELQFGDRKTKVNLALVTHEINDFRLNLSADATNNHLVDLNRKCLLGKKKPQELKNIYGNFITQKPRLKIGILATNKYLYSHERLIEACLLYTSPSPRD